MSKSKTKTSNKQTKQKEADTRAKAKKLIPHKPKEIRQIIHKLRGLCKDMPFGERLYSREYYYWGQKIRDILSETHQIVIWLVRLQYPQKKWKLLKDKRSNVNVNQPKFGGPFQLVQIPYELRDAMIALSDELVAIEADLATGTAKDENETDTGRGQKEKENIVAVTITEFMEQYCKPLSKRLLHSRKVSLFKANGRGLQLPDYIGVWKSGKPKRFNPVELTTNWPKYRDYLPNLPLLKQSH